MNVETEYRVVRQFGEESQMYIYSICSVVYNKGTSNIRKIFNAKPLLVANPHYFSTYLAEYAEALSKPVIDFDTKQEIS